MQVHVAPPEATRLPAPLLAALGDGEPNRGGGGGGAGAGGVGVANAKSRVVPDGERVQRALGRLARRRAEAVTHALAKRGVPARRLVATAPGYNLGMMPAGQLTIHALPEALQPRRRAEAGGGNWLGVGDEDDEERREVEEEERALERLREDEEEAAGGEAMAELLARRDAQLADARRELDELHRYASSLPSLALPAPLTLVVSVVEMSAPDARPLPCICLGTERVSDRVAGFEVADASSTSSTSSSGRRAPSPAAPPSAPSAHAPSRSRACSPAPSRPCTRRSPSRTPRASSSARCASSSRPARLITTPSMPPRPRQLSTDDAAR